MAISLALEASPFGRLSAELRLMIWEFALYSEGGIQLNHVEANPEESNMKNDDKQDASSSPTLNDGLELSVFTLDDTSIAEKNPPILSLTETCKQIR
jgi:hypothetical protein